MCTMALPACASKQHWLTIVRPPMSRILALVCMLPRSRLPDSDTAKKQRRSWVPSARLNLQHRHIEILGVRTFPRLHSYVCDHSPRISSSSQVCVVVEVFEGQGLWYATPEFTTGAEAFCIRLRMGRKSAFRGQCLCRNSSMKLPSSHPRGLTPASRASTQRSRRSSMAGLSRYLVAFLWSMAELCKCVCVKSCKDLTRVTSRTPRGEGDTSANPGRLPTFFADVFPC